MTYQSLEDAEKEVRINMASIEEDMHLKIDQLLSKANIFRQIKEKVNALFVADKPKEIDLKTHVIDMAMSFAYSQLFDLIFSFQKNKDDRNLAFQNSVKELTDFYFLKYKDDLVINLSSWIDEKILKTKESSKEDQLDNTPEK